MRKKLCAVCGILAPLKCSGCCAVNYCSRDHQKIDWKNHKPNCQPPCTLFLVEWDPQIGHHLVASRDIQPFEIILEEVPWVVGPTMTEGPAVCVGCCYDLNGIVVPCPNCRWPMCGRKQCWTQGSQHALGECSLLKAAGTCVTENFANRVTKEVYPSIMYLRCLALKKRDPAKWSKLMDLKYCGRDDQLIQLEETIDRAEIIQLVKKLLPTKDDSISIESIGKLCTAFAVNVFDLPALPPVRDSELHGIYPMGCLIDHSCLANAAKTFTKNGKLMVRAALPITKGSKITLNYNKVFSGTLKRNLHLAQTKFGSCRCDRCKDPTELGTYLSGIYCQNCPKQQEGILLPEYPLDKESHWICTKCSDRQPAVVITTQLELFQKDFDSLFGVSVYELETLIRKYKKILHPHHYLLCKAKWALCKTYGELEAKAGQFSKKEAIVRELIGIVDVISPGVRQIRGNMLFHLFCVVMHQWQKMSIDKRNHVPSIALPLHQMAEKIMREAYEILSWGRQEETAESSDVRKYANVLENAELQVIYWETQKLVAEEN